MGRGLGRIFAAAAVGAAVAAGATSAQAVTISYFNNLAGWQAAVTPETLEDFSAPDPLGRGWSLSGGSVSFGEVGNLDGAIIFVNFFVQGTSTPTSVFGAGIRINNGVPGAPVVEVRAYDAGHNLLGTIGGTRGDFAGFTSDSGIFSLEIDGLPIPPFGEANTEFDDLRYSTVRAVVPVPAPLALLGLGALALGWSRRKKA